MDERLRAAQRHFQKTGLISDEINYLRELRRAQQIADEQLEKAAYFGSEAANEIIPYDTPYEIARLMRTKPPKPPETSWFCNGIYQERDLHDIADVWCQIDMIGTDDDPEDAGYETVLLANLLMLYYLCWDGMRKAEVWWQGTSIAYNQMRKALLSKTPNYLARENPPAPETLLRTLWDLIHSYLGDDSVQVDIPLDLRWTSEELLNMTPRHLRRKMCDFVAVKLQKYLLGYITLEQLLPKIS